MTFLIYILFAALFVRVSLRALKAQPAYAKFSEKDRVITSGILLVVSIFWPAFLIFGLLGLAFGPNPFSAVAGRA